VSFKHSFPDTERIRIRIRDMKRMGFGGFFISSRFGFGTLYLGDMIL